MTTTFTAHMKNLTDLYKAYDKEPLTELEIESDIIDLYKNGGLADAFPYLDDLNEDDYNLETIMISENASLLAALVTKDTK